MGVGYGRYKLTLQNDPEFRTEVKGIDDLLIEPIVALRRRAAIDLDDADAQEFLIARHDKAKQFAANMRMRRKELEAQKQAIDAGLAAEVIQKAKEMRDARRGGG